MAKRKSEVYVVIEGVVGECVGSTQQDCVKWMRKKEIAEAAFYRKICVLKGEPVTTFRVKEVGNAVGTKRKRRVQANGAGAGKEAEMFEPGFGETGDQAPEGEGARTDLA